MDDFFTILIYVVGAALVLWAIFKYVKWYVHHHSDLERSMNMVFLKIQVPKKESKEDVERESQSMASGADFKSAVGIASHMFDSLHSIYTKSMKHYFTGQDFLSLEYAVVDGEIHFYIVVPRELVGLVEKQVTGFYPDCYVEKVQDYNIFKPNSQTTGCYMELTKEYWFPVKNFNHLNSDPINNLTNVLSKLTTEDGAVIQIMVKPKKDGWQEHGRHEAKEIFNQKKGKGHSSLNPLSWIAALFDFFVKGEINETKEHGASDRTTPLTDEEVKMLEEKNSKIGYETIIRIVTSSPSHREAKANLQNIKSAFAQYNSPAANGFTYTKHTNEKALIKNFIYRHFHKPWPQKIHHKKMVLSSDELASLFHLPNIRYNKTPNIAWQNYKVSPPPHNIPKEGIILGHNTYRGETKEIKMKNEDRFRHFYVIGQTGTGKSSIFQVMIRQDLEMGHGIAVVDPHGSLIDDIMPFIPRSRADDVIYFNPADLERPLGLNILEGESWEEKELVALDAMNIMIKLFNEEIFGPRIQDYFRNGCLTLMSNPEGGSLTDIVRLFTDDDFQRMQVTHVTNPIVRSFWENQMAKTGAREKQEMIPYFAAKFGQFVTNSMMRNIIGQAKSAFDFMKVMQEGKILLMNLSKGEVGEINSKLIGLIIVSKIQMAALRRQRIPKDERRDFFLYIDEFQNYITDSIESILSEARKYRLSLNLAHQYIAQLEGSDGKSKVKDAVFGNVGTMMCYKIGAQDAEYMAKEMAPVFSDQDLVNLDKFKAVMKLSIDTQPSRPFSITPVNPYLQKGDLEAAEAFKQLSRLKYGRDREFVDHEIMRRIGAIL